MRIQALTVWILLKLLALCYAISVDDFAFPIDKSSYLNNSRLTEIKNHCSPFISSASELKFDENKASSLKKELSFFNGDWEQDTSHGATLMPFDDSDMPYAMSFIYPLKLVSFEVRNVSSNGPHQPKNTVNVSGVLSIGITRNSTVISEPGLGFHTTPGMSALRVDFEGVYLETEENGGERLLCLLGNSIFPFKKVPKRHSDDYIMTYFAVEETDDEEPAVLPHGPHDQFSKLVLRYPKNPSLPNSRIYGEMTSLSEDDEYDYFDKVYINSHSGIIQDYGIGGPDELNLESFHQNPLKDAILEDGVHKFNNSELCRVLKYFEQEAYRVMPSLKLGGQNAFQDTVGPFVLKNEIQLVDRNNENLRVILHQVRCENDKVSGVLRMYPVTIKPHVVARRTGLSTLTLLVNGAWNSSTGLLSMTGCLGPDLVKCDSGVILYFPKSFSSKQRNAISGCIFSLTNATKPFHPVFIGLEMLYPGLYDNGSYGRDYLSYNYSKHDLAIEFKERIQEPRLITYIRKLLFTYPSVLDEKDGIFNISNHLLDDLKIDTFSSFETFVNIEVLSLGPLFRTSDTSFFEASNTELLNVSLNLLITEDPKKFREQSYRHVSKLYLEGVYDLRVGKMYLIGCRKVDFDHVNLERGLDCMIEVTIQYSPVNTRWLINPMAKISIASQRNETDVYQFETIRLQTFMVHDKNHRKNVIFRKIFDGYFRILLLSMYIANISILMLNMKKSQDSVAYISILTLTMWIIGYGIDLIYRKEILVKSSETPYYISRPYYHESHKQYLKNLDYFARFLVMVTMFQMARIIKMVMKARKLLSQQGESTPSEKKVILVTFGVCICYLIIVIALCGFDLYQHDVTFTKDYSMTSFIREVWYSIPDLQSYMLIPQIIALRIWKPRFLGRIFGHFVLRQWIILTVQFVYEGFRDPVTYPV